MVEIRRLQPSVRIRMPQKPTGSARERSVSNRTWFPRSRKDHPSPTPLDTPCVLWQGPIDNHGYGRLTRNRKPKRIHRYILELYRDRPLGKTQVVMHLCDQPLCFRFDHLKIGTLADNNADMFAKGRAKPPPPRGTPPGIKARIRHGYRDGLTVAELCREYGLHRKTVSRIVANTQFATGKPKKFDGRNRPPKIGGA